jgi:hypothetical protein
MKRAVGFLICVALIGSAQLTLSPTVVLSPTSIYAQAPAPSTGGRIAGRVVSADTGNPLARARVQITSSMLPKPRQISTDASGRYEVTGLAAGRYKILVTRAGFVSLEYGQTRPYQSGRELELLDGQTIGGIDFALPRGGVITGRITDHNGEPQAGIPVFALRLSWRPDGTRHLEPVSPGTLGLFDRNLTDDLGHYRIYALMPGSYIVGAGTLPGRMPVPDPAAVEGTTYYPGTANVDEAQTVEVAMGQEVPVHFALAATPLARVSGTIVDSKGQPVVWRSVLLSTRTGGVSYRTAATTRPDGTFEISAVPPGNYTIEVSPLRTQPNDFEFASFPISVEGHDITDLIISMKVGATVNGRVIWEGSSPEPFATQRIVPVAVDPRLSAATPASGGGTVDAKGNFSLVGVHGPVVFQTSFTGRAEPWSLKAVRIGATDITDVGYNVTSDIDNLEVVMTDRATRVSGIARDDRYQPATDYVVVFLPSEVRPGVNPTRFIQTAQPDQLGRYQIKALPPGQYVAAAVESLSRDGHYNPAFQKRVRSTGTSFTLKEGQQLVLDLQLMP